MQLRHKLFKNYGNSDILKHIKTSKEFIEMLETIESERERTEDYLFFCSNYEILKEKDFNKFCRIKLKPLMKEIKTNKEKIKKKSGKTQQEILNEVELILKCKR